MCCKLFIYNEDRKDSREAVYVRNESNVYVTPSCITLCEKCTFRMYTRTSQM